MWLAQKALSLYMGVKLDDPASDKYRTDCFPPLTTTRHSKTWRWWPKEMRGDPMILKVHLEVCAMEFLHEVNFLSQLAHPNICELLDVSFMSKHGNCMVIADAGENLLHWIRESTKKGDPPCDRLVELVPQMFQGLQYVHSRSIVHCDVKPGNICVNTDGVLRFIDFGCAFVDLPGHRPKRDFDTIEKDGLQYGTTPYRAIEIAVGDEHFGKPADMWSAGCVLFEMLVCKGLFRSDIKIDELVPECFAQLGQHDNIAALAAQPRWLPRYAQTKVSVADFWRRVGTVTAVGPGIADTAFKLLNFDPRQRPTAEGCLDLWCQHVGAPFT